MMLAMSILPPEDFNFTGIYYISDNMAAANLDMAKQLAILKAAKDDFPLF